MRSHVNIVSVRSTFVSSAIGGKTHTYFTDKYQVLDTLVLKFLHVKPARHQNLHVVCEMMIDQISAGGVPTTLPYKIRTLNISLLLLRAIGIVLNQCTLQH